MAVDRRGNTYRVQGKHSESQQEPEQKLWPKEEPRGEDQSRGSRGVAGNKM
jgi:hypothetical protein